MKRSFFPLIVLIAIVVSLSGCSKKHMVKSATTTIMTPPNVSNGAAGNITVTIPDGGNHVLLSILFAGNNTETVTINGQPEGNPAAQGVWSSVEEDKPGTYTIAANEGQPSAPYSNVQSLPVAGGSSSIGTDITVYTDSQGNKAVITIMDLQGLQ